MVFFNLLVTNLQVSNQGKLEHTLSFSRYNFHGWTEGREEKRLICSFLIFYIIW